jgi:hypothetical protein
MAGQSRILTLPYFAQPTGDTCQSTCLKMVSCYIERYIVSMNTGAFIADIIDIKKTINHDPNRPDKVNMNSHGNMKWWLERRFPQLKFSYSQMDDEARALEGIVNFINSGFPVMVSVSHARVPGHIILTVGYKNYLPNVSPPDFSIVIHDPYGAFDPNLRSRLFSTRRWEAGMSLAVGGQQGPGQNVSIPITGAGRQRIGDDRKGKYYLLSARR